MNAGVRIHGLREVNAAFRKVDTKLVREFGNDLKKAALPVVEQTQQLEQQWAGASISTIRARRSGPTVYVEQSARKKTGLRGDFGALQMRAALEPALEDKSDIVFREVEHVLNHYANSAGF